ncbi:hypothetical protein ACS0TY_017418 [Phlomoides rotata]
MGDELTLLDFWSSPFAMRVRIALKEKGLEYESMEEQEPTAPKNEPGSQTGSGSDPQGEACVRLHHNS